MEAKNAVAQHGKQLHLTAFKASSALGGTGSQEDPLYLRGAELRLGQGPG